MKQNPFHVVADRLESLENIRVDRDLELDLILSALVYSRHNVLVYGERGVGKSFLIRLIQHELETKHRSIFCSYINLNGLHAYGRNNENDMSGAFARAVLVQLCTQLWKRLAKGRYLELRRSLEEYEPTEALGPAERTVQRIYAELMRSDVVARHNALRSVFFDVGHVTTRGESASTEHREPDLLPFEFLEMAEELISQVLLPTNRDQVIILCDEGNHLPLFEQQEILRHHLELFGAKRIQFVFVAGFRPGETLTLLPTAFETRVELLGFPEYRYAQEMIEKVGNGCEIQFSPDAIQCMFELSRGNPRFLMEACARGFEIAQQRSIADIDVGISRSACVQLIEAGRRANEHLQ